MSDLEITRSRQPHDAGISASDACNRPAWQTPRLMCVAVKAAEATEGQAPDGDDFS